MHPGYFPVLIWSLVVFASFWGYGEALRRLLNRPEFSDLGWGLTAALGILKEKTLPLEHLPRTS